MSIPWQKKTPNFWSPNSKKGKLFYPLCYRVMRADKTSPNYSNFVSVFVCQESMFLLEHSKLLIRDVQFIFICRKHLTLHNQDCVFPYLYCSAFSCIFLFNNAEKARNIKGWSNPLHKDTVKMLGFCKGLHLAAKSDNINENPFSLFNFCAMCRNMDKNIESKWKNMWGYWFCLYKIEMSTSYFTLSG